MKKIILGAAALAMLAGCNKGGDEPSNPFDTATIHLDPNTIRPYKGSVATLLTMQGDTGGFSVWASTPATGWYNGINGIHHIYDNGVWNFDPSQAWPTDAASYPMDFYAVYPASGFNPSFSTTVDGSAETVEINANVPLYQSGQLDILAGTQTVSVKPASGNLGVVFHHILSKINFALDMRTGLTAYVQGLQINDVGQSGTYSLNSMSWVSTPYVYSFDYEYYGTILASASGGVTPITHSSIALAGSDTAMTPFYTASTSPTAANANLMLMPQNSISRTWGGSVAPTALPTAAESYITMVYRLSEGTADLAGLAQAQSHPDFVGSDLAAQPYPGTDPLFIKVGYPFVLAWDPGKGYMYNINLDNTAAGATGGYLLDDFYYDNKGNRTDLRVDAVAPGITIPDPLFGDGDIHLVPDPSDWDDSNVSMD